MIVLSAAAILALALTSFGCTDHQNVYAAEAPPASVVQIDGCTGVCVDPSGVILTAKHCDHKIQESIRFPDPVGTVKAHRVYVSPETDGPVVFVTDQPGEYPASPLGDGPPPVGSRVYSWGYPANSVGARNLSYAEGVVVEGRKTPPPIGLPPLAPPYRVNVVSGLICDGGWSGGPLYNEAGQVVGLCSAGGRDVSLWISYGEIAIAMAFVPGRRLPGEVRIVDVCTDPRFCDPCRAFAADEKRGRFPGYQFKASLPADENGPPIPTFFYLGNERSGYDGGAPALLSWLKTCEAEAVPDEPPTARPTTPPGRRPSDDIAAIKDQLSKVIEDVREFQEAGPIGKLRQIDDLKADVEDAKALATTARNEIAKAKADAEGHPWWYGVPAAVFGIIKRRYLNRGAVAEV